MPDRFTSSSCRPERAIGVPGRRDGAGADAAAAVSRKPSNQCRRPVAAGAAAGIQYSISGPDLGKLGEYSAALLGKMKSLPDLADADTSLVIGKPEFRVEIDRQRAADLGVRVQDIAQALEHDDRRAERLHVRRRRGSIRRHVARERTVPHQSRRIEAADRVFDPARGGHARRGRPRPASHGAVEHPAPEQATAGHVEREPRSRRVAGRRDRAAPAGGRRHAPSGGVLGGPRRRIEGAGAGGRVLRHCRSHCLSSSCTSFWPRSSSRSFIRSRFC